MMVNSDVDGYTETLNTPKNAKTQQLSEKKRTLKTKYTVQYVK